MRRAATPCARRGNHSGGNDGLVSSNVCSMSSYPPDSCYDSATGMSADVRCFDMAPPNHERDLPYIHRHCSRCSRCAPFETRTEKTTRWAPRGTPRILFSISSKTTNITNTTNNADECCISCVRPLSGYAHIAHIRRAPWVMAFKVARLAVTLFPLARPGACFSRCNKSPPAENRCSPLGYQFVPDKWVQKT